MIIVSFLQVACLLKNSTASTAYLKYTYGGMYACNYNYMYIARYCMFAHSQLQTHSQLQATRDIYIYIYIQYNNVCMYALYCYM